MRRALMALAAFLVSLTVLPVSVAATWFGAGTPAQNPPAPAVSPESPEPIRVISLNVRFDTRQDGENSWKFRQERVTKMLRESGADFVGLQEVLPSQRADISEALPGWGWLGRSREASAAEGEANPIFYRRSRWTPIDGRNGTFWLSETPSVAGSKSWKSACPRIATWGVFREQSSGRRVFVLNTHLDHQSQEAREYGARVIAEFLSQEAQELPVIVTGDFNAGPVNPARVTLCEGVSASPPLVDTYSAAHALDERDAGTFHGFRGGNGGLRIDAILISQQLSVIEATIDRRTADGQQLSDHYPVTAQLSFRADAPPPIPPPPPAPTPTPTLPSETSPSRPFVPPAADPEPGAR